MSITVDPADLEDVAIEDRQRLRRQLTAEREAELHDLLLHDLDLGRVVAD